MTDIRGNVIGFKKSNIMEKQFFKIHTFLFKVVRLVNQENKCLLMSA